MHELEIVRRILRFSDNSDDVVFTFAETRTWPSGLRDRLVELGILREISRTDSLTCDRCEEACVIEPAIVEDRRHHGLVGYYYCSDEENGGPCIFEMEEFHAWAADFGGIAAFVAGQLGLAGEIKPVVAGRTCMLGGFWAGGMMIDVFLVRGLTRPDSASLLQDAERLRASRWAALLVPDALPLAGFWPEGCPAVAALTEVITIENGDLMLDQKLLSERITEGSKHRVPDSDAVESTALTTIEVDILQAMAASPRVAMFHVDIMAAAGYSKRTTQQAIERLRELGMVARPGETKRKGEAVTTKGQAYLQKCGRHLGDAK